jgi:hypothetical protein
MDINWIEFECLQRSYSSIRQRDFFQSFEAFVSEFLDYTANLLAGSQRDIGNGLAEYGSQGDCYRFSGR